MAHEELVEVWRCLLSGEAHWRIQGLVIDSDAG